MYIPDGILKRKLANVCFLWGRGKTTIANILRERYGAAVYSTDDARDRLYDIADPSEQPYLCRDYNEEYGVRSFWELPAEVIADREQHVLRELTPFVMAELLPLAERNALVICEGDLDYEAAAQVATCAVWLRNLGTKFDWFDRPDHGGLEGIRARTDLTPEEIEAIVANAYRAVSGAEQILPEWTARLGVPHIDWDDEVTPEQTARETAALFGLG